MSYLLRVVLPDRPGMLGAVATALGEAGGDIVSLDVVERGPDGAVDDLVVTMPPGGLADALITAAQRVPGVVVESLRPYFGGGTCTATSSWWTSSRPTRGRPVLLVANAPGVFRAGWAVLLEPGPTVLHASPGAPAGEGLDLGWLPLDTARRLPPEAPWVPERWQVLGTELVAAPVGSPYRVVLVGRPGGPRFRGSEVLRLAHLAGITATVEAGRQPVA
jgi:hypothetical protein